MKRFIISLLFVVTLCVLLVQPMISSAILAFLFLGIIPGTNIQIPFWIMALTFVIGGFLLIKWLGSQPLYIGGLAKQEQTARKIARKKIVKKAHYSSARTHARKRYKTARHSL